MKEEQTKIQKQLEESQRLLAEKEKLEAQLSANLEEAQKKVETTRELQKEIKNLKVTSSSSIPR